MECLIVLPEDVEEERSTLLLRGEEAHHAVRALRLRAGDELLTTNLHGTSWLCRIAFLDTRTETVTCAIVETLPNVGEPERDVLLIQGMIAQPARWEFLLEKATELGVSAIAPVVTERTEYPRFKRERAERILRAAVKQSKRSRLPTLLLDEQEDLLPLQDALERAAADGRTILLLHEAQTGLPPLTERLRVLGATQPLAIVVGPEGGFSAAELDLARSFGAALATLGPRRLRAETAAMAALAMV